jgi:hypothetical protein
LVPRKPTGGVNERRDGAEGECVEDAEHEDIDSDDDDDVDDDDDDEEEECEWLN